MQRLQVAGKTLLKGKAKPRTYYLVKYADLFDGILLEGFRLFTGAEFNRWLMNLPVKFPVNIWIGGTHHILYESYEEYTSKLLIAQITEHKYNYLQQQFAQQFGNFPNII